MMAHYFDRLCRVIIEGVMEIDINENKISFEITKSRNSRENIGRIEIWNLSSDTRKQITASDSKVRLFAGYANYKGLIEIGQGDITNVRHNRSRTDIVTQIYVEEGHSSLRKTLISFSFDGDVRLSDILNKLTQESSMYFKCSGINTSVSAGNGYSAIGGLDLILNDLALLFKFRWSMQGGGILIQGSQPITDAEVMLLTPETGLILNPSSVKKISVKLAKSDAPPPVDTYALQALLQPHLGVGDLIALKSQDLNGSFRISKISHTGDTRGNDWYSNIEVTAR